MGNNEISPVATNIVKTFAATVDAIGTTRYGQVAAQDEDLASAKVDWQATSKHSLFVDLFYYFRL